MHPVAWWGWAIGLAIAASLTTNPFLLALLTGVIVLVVLARRGSSPWARAFRIYAWLGAAVIGFRVIFHVLVGLKYGEIRLFWLPTIGLPKWAAGIELGGPVYLEGLLAAVLLGARLAVLILAIGAANALANPKRLLRAFPRALTEIGTAVVVAVSVAPQLAESVQRVSRARALRGEPMVGLRALPRVAIPVLQDTLDRSLALASAMESRGYGGRQPQRSAWVATLTLGGLVLTAWGLYGLLAADSTAWWTGPWVLVLGAGACASGLWAAGRSVAVTTYRPDTWGWPETFTVACGCATAVALLWTRAVAPGSLDMPLQPLGPPPLPWLALIGILIGVIPALTQPEESR